MSKRTRQILRFLAVVLSVLGAVHYLIFMVTAPDLSRSLQIALLGILVVGWVCLPMGLLASHGSWRKRLKPVTYFAYFWTGYFFITFSFVLIELLLSVFIEHGYSYWPLLAALLACVWSAIHALRPPRIITHELHGPAAINGLTLVQISDVHIGMPFLNQQWLAKQVARINELRPDFIAITGDLADGPFARVSPELAPLADLKPLKRKFYVTGNHEFIRGGDWERRLADLGFSVLHNTHEIFETAGGKFMIAGVPDQVIVSQGSHFESSPEKALASRDGVDYRILLAHEPRSVFKLNGAQCDLMLTGHTHGGQIFPFAMFVRMVQPVVRGFKKIDGVLVFAHMGTGYWGPPLRWLTSSEIVRFRWTNKGGDS